MTVLGDSDLGSFQQRLQRRNCRRFGQHHELQGWKITKQHSGIKLQSGRNVAEFNHIQSALARFIS